RKFWTCDYLIMVLHHLNQVVKDFFCSSCLWVAYVPSTALERRQLMVKWFYSPTSMSCAGCARLKGRA
ncbi:hypothetical protein A2U01_0048256, partial [Trifolium medium]|nr:hypothetical protein [Trifolium medium]